MERLYRLHWPRAYRAAYLVVHDAAGAEDIAQEAFLAAVRALDRFDRRRPFGPWLHRIVVNRAIDWSRARALRHEVGVDAVPEAAAALPSGGGALDDAVVAALEGLSAEHRAVVVLRYLLEFTPGEIARILGKAGVRVLDGDVCEIGGVGFAGVKGFGGGFAGACASNFGEREMKDFVGTTEVVAERLQKALLSVQVDALVALTHYAPVPDTLLGEPLEIYAFLGCYQLGRAIDSAPAALAVHGHAHHGTERGRTPGGVPVRNVAHPVIKQAYNVYQLLSEDVDLQLVAT